MGQNEVIALQANFDTGRKRGLLSHTLVGYPYEAAGLVEALCPAHNLTS